MRLERVRDNILIRDPDVTEKKYLASQKCWVFSPHARAWIVPEWAFAGLPPAFHRVPIEGSPGVSVPRGNPLSLTLLPAHLQKTMYPFQRDIGCRMVESSWGAWHDAGTGKTLCTLAAYRILRAQGKVDGIIIIGPENGRHVWCGPNSDSAKWINEPGHYVESGGELEPPRDGIIYITAAKTFMAPYQTWITQRIQTRRFILCIDECHQCFTYETSITTDVGELPIGDVVEKGLGTKALSYNKDTNSTEWRTISNRFRNRSRELVRVQHEQGNFECTADHKIWTLEKGYVRAAELSNETLCYLQCTLHMGSQLHQESETEVLLSEVCSPIRRQKGTREEGGCDGRSEAQFPKDAIEQPYAEPRDKKESLEHPSSYETQTPQARWERKGVTSSASISAFYSRSELDTGTPNTDKNASIIRVSKLLQSRSSYSVSLPSNRSEWSESLQLESQSQGRKENNILRTSRVVSVNRSEQRCYDGPLSDCVYDIEVEGNHNYFADGVLVSNCSGPLSKRFAQLRAWARYCAYRWLLSATPTSNYPDSFWAPYCILTNSDVSLDTWNKWFRVGDRTGSQSKWHRARLEGLGRYLSYCTSVVRKADVAPWLPPVTEQIMRIPLQGKQREWYRALVNAARQTTGALGQQIHAGAKSWKHQLIYLSSMASHPILSETTGWDETDIAKLDALRMLISSAGDQKMCVWSWHPRVLEWIADQIGRDKCVLYHGEVSPAQKTMAVQKFNQDPNTQFFLGNPQAAGTSLNLGAGTVRIFWDLGWSYVQFHQACERINRITRTLPITSYVLISEGTVEEIMWKAIQRKQELASFITSETTATGDDTLMKEVLALWKT